MPQVGVLGGDGRAAGSMATGSNQGVCCTWADIKTMHLVAGLHQSHRHGCAHGPQANKTNSHESSLFLDRACHRRDIVFDEKGIQHHQRQGAHQGARHQ